jgi:cytochrome bd ubiquinol oxidase subunit II
VNISWADGFAGLIFFALVLYALTGGADFGGGVWDLLARGPRPAAQRRLIDAAIAPIWEANHIWLIFIVVLLLTAFPPVFAAAAIGLHLPLVLMLLGITLRGAAFVFRHYGPGGIEGAAAQRWGRVFAWASTGTPILLGIVLGAATRGVHSTGGNLYASAGDWTAPFALAMGAFTLALFAHLAAVFLAAEAAEAAGTAEASALAEDFRRRAIISGGAALLLGGACVLTADAPLARFSHHLLHSWWSAPLGAATAGATCLTAWLLQTARWRWARLAAIAQVVGVLVGWAAAQYPVLLAPALTVDNAASPLITLYWIAPVVLAGSVLLVPSLFWLLRTFKGDRARRDAG